MISQKNQGMDAPFMAAFISILGLMGFVAWDQSHWWREKEDYSFGWLVPLFVLYVICDRWPRIAARLKQNSIGVAHVGHMKSEGAGLIGAGVVLTGGVGLFLLGALYRAAAGPSYAGTLALALGLGAASLAAVYFLAPVEAGADRPAERWALARLFFFPATVWLVSAPMITVVENNLSVFLMHQVTSVVFSIFDFLGLPLEQQGNVLLLPSGSVGVAEACSGIRSLTGCVFAGSFLAAVFLEPPWKKLFLVGASLALAFVTNLLRSIFLTAWSYNYGPHAIEGFVHDMAGYSVLGLTTIGLLCLLPIFGRGQNRSEDPLAISQ